MIPVSTQALLQTYKLYGLATESGLTMEVSSHGSPCVPWTGKQVSAWIPLREAQMADFRLSLGVHKAIVSDNRIRVYATSVTNSLLSGFKQHFLVTNVSVNITYHLTDICMLVHPPRCDHWKHILLFFHRTKMGPAQPQRMGRE